VTVGTVMSELGLPGAFHYVAAKAGVVGLTRALAREVGADGIRGDCVLPGAIRTEQELDTGVDQREITAAAAARQSIPGGAWPRTSSVPSSSSHRARANSSVARCCRWTAGGSRDDLPC
jgi:NAD(P)-dependent dehydrogenase (short-subunit alcohol dehydrogenase family)